MGRCSEYKQVRNYENLQKAMYSGDGAYDIPMLNPVTEIDVDNWISFNYVKGHKNPKKTGVHFFVDDYQFERVWKYPEKYVGMLAKFGAVCTPDFSPYSDFPKAVQVFQHYKKHWCGAYWQEHGVTVIPTITWSSPDTLEWAFDGEPFGSIIATSTLGMKTDAILEGYKLIMEYLEPVKILWKGKIPDELHDEVARGFICRLPSHNDKWRQLDKRKDGG